MNEKLEVEIGRESTPIPALKSKSKQKTTRKEGEDKDER
jgi:hypothetical protein